MNLVNIYNNVKTIYLFCRDKDGNLKITVDDSFYPYYYTESATGSFKSYNGKRLQKVFVNHPGDIKKQRNNRAWEADINYTKRYLLDKVDKLDKTSVKFAFIDIEIQTKDGNFVDANKANRPISSISIYNSFTKQIKTYFILDFKSEYDLIEAFIEETKKEQFDLMAFWNASFDYTYLFHRIDNFAERISPIGKSRYVNEDLKYPAGISIVDYLLWYKIVFKGLSAYSLDNVALHEFKQGKTLSEVDFSTISEEIRTRNREDVEILAKIENKHHLIDYYNEIRIFAKTEWEDLHYNSRTIDSLLLQEAHKQGLILPTRPFDKEVEKEEFEAAYRCAYDTGLFNNVGKFDLSGAYSNILVDLCLDPANITTKDNGIPIEITDRESNIVKDIIYVNQNKNSSLPIVVEKLNNEKNKWKEIKNNTDPSTEEYKNIENKYNAIKAISLSSWGVIGNQFFRLYNSNIASTITSCIRSLLHYVENKLREQGKEILYIDTDCVFNKNCTEDITNLLNQLIQDWAKEKFNKSVNIKFEYEGYFESIIILALCRYKGRLNTGHGIKEEIRGIETKRVDSSKFMKKFQNELLNKILNKEPKEYIITYVKDKIKSIINEPIEQIAFPCKINKEEYKSKPISARALEYTQELYPTFKKPLGERFYYIYVKSDNYEEIKVKAFFYNDKKVTKTTLKKELKERFGNENPTDNDYDWIMTKMMEEGKIKEEWIYKEGKNKDVLAFDDKVKDHIKNVDYVKMIERNILNKIDVIFTAMKWGEEYQDIVNFSNTLV